MRYHIVLSTDNRVQVADTIVDGKNKFVQGTDKIVHEADNIVREADNIVRVPEHIVHGTDHVVGSLDKKEKGGNAVAQSAKHQPQFRQPEIRTSFKKERINRNNLKSKIMSRKIPKADGAFNSYINSTADYLAEGTPTHAVRLGLSVTQTTEWTDRRTAWNLIYAKHNDASKRTPTVIAEKDSQKAAFVAFANPVLGALKYNPALTQDDRGAFNLPERDAPTERGEITDAPYGKLMPMDGGKMQVRVRSTADGNRASKHADADHLEMRYELVDASKGEAVPDPNTLPPGPGGPVTTKPGVPATAKDCTQSVISKKAIFIVQLGQESSGKRIYAFFRWVNASKPANSGPWSTVQQTVVV